MRFTLSATIITSFEIEDAAYDGVKDKLIYEQNRLAQSGVITYLEDLKLSKCVKIFNSTSTASIKQGD